MLHGTNDGLALARRPLRAPHDGEDPGADRRLAITLSLSGRRLTVVQEPDTALGIGARPQDGVYISDLERSLLDAAARPGLVGGAAVLAEAIGAAVSKGLDVARLTSYARELSWGPALRRIGSIADTLQIGKLAGRLEPLTRPTSDIELEPGQDTSSYRDSK